MYPDRSSSLASAALPSRVPSDRHHCFTPVFHRRRWHRHPRQARRKICVPRRARGAQLLHQGDTVRVQRSKAVRFKPSTTPTLFGRLQQPQNGLVPGKELFPGWRQLVRVEMRGATKGRPGEVRAACNGLAPQVGAETEELGACRAVLDAARLRAPLRFHRDLQGLPLQENCGPRPKSSRIGRRAIDQLPG